MASSSDNAPGEQWEVISVSSNESIHYEYEIEAVYGSRVNKFGQKELLIKWLGHEDAYNCWVHERRVPWNFRGEFGADKLDAAYEEIEDAKKKSTLKTIIVRDLYPKEKREDLDEDMTLGGLSDDSDLEDTDSEEECE